MAPAGAAIRRLAATFHPESPLTPPGRPRRDPDRRDPSRLLAGRLLGRNTGLNLVGQGLPLVVAVVAIPILIPGIGTERFGLLVIAWILLGYFSMFDLGLGRSLTQVTADRLGRGRQDEVPGLIRTGLRMMGALGVVGGGLLFLAAPFVAHRLLGLSAELGAETVRAIRLLALAVPFVVLTAGLRGLLESVQRFGSINAIRIPQGILTYLAPLAVLPWSRALPALVGALVGVRVAAWAAHAVLVRRAFPEAATARAGEGGHAAELLRVGGWITVSNVVGPLMVYLDRFLIGAVLGATAVAYYATPFEVVSRLWVVPGAIAAVYFPAFATSFRADPERAAALFATAGRITLAVVFPFAFVLMAFAPEGLALWVGEEFAGPGAPVARWLLVGVVVNAVAQVPFAFLQGIGRPDVTARLHLLEAPLYLALLWWLLGAYGITGAAVAWTVRVVLDAALLFWLSGKLLPGTRHGARSLGLYVTGGVLVLGLSAVPVGAAAGRAVLVAGLALASGGAAFLAWRRGRQDRSDAREQADVP